MLIVSDVSRAVGCGHDLVLVAVGVSPEVLNNECTPHCMLKIRSE